MLTGRVAMITGGNRALRRRSAKGFITGRPQAALDEAIAEIGDHATGPQGDAASLTDLDRIYDAVMTQAGHIDVQVANAGVHKPGALGGSRRMSTRSLGRVAPAQIPRAFDNGCPAQRSEVSRESPPGDWRQQCAERGPSGDAGGTPRFDLFRQSSILWQCLLREGSDMLL